MQTTTAVQRTLLAFALALAVLVTGLAFAGEGGDCEHKAQGTTAAKADHHQKIAERAKHGWLGIETEHADRGYRITKVHDSSPAAAAGFRAGDVLVAMNGIAFAEDNKAELKAAKAKLWPGSQVEYTVVRGGAEQQVAATLAPVPEAVLAEWQAEADREAAMQVAEND
jgi:predicted metalloprotease with PDZ domain